MTMSVGIDLGYEFEVRATFDEVFALLSDVPRSGAHFPRVEQLTDLGDGVYRWELQKIGTAQFNLQTVYACRYASDKAKGTVNWTPVEGVGNAQVAGSWKISDRRGKSTHCVLKTQGTVDLPLPGLMKPVIAPVIEHEFEQRVEKYIDNLIKEFGGEV